ncbi:MAG: L-fucose/L-arabinose isomerase family protein [Athalassotoga sp.]|uniref:L-fucose/L-arabinose isomerase family protein n=1 Tax=Athalassotoga sp. TaxID=2022597 RepID=UPI003CFC4B2B
MMEKIKVGIITFSDGRPKVNADLLEINKRFQSELSKALQSTNEIEVVEAKEIVSKPSIAKSEGLRMKNAGVHLTIFNYAVWAFPHFSVISSKFAPGPFLLFGNVNPQYPGMVGMLAAAGALDQTGVIHKRVWGGIKDPKVLKQMLSFIRAAYAFNSLRGQRYGIIGGRPMGMYTAVPNVDLWNSIFGIDIDHIDQYDVVRLSAEVPESRAEAGLKWLESHVKKVHYDGKQLTPEKLKLQIKSYHAIQKIIKDNELDFAGIKAQPELTDNFATMDVAEAFMNDPYDWEGTHEPFVFATEADSDGALTMQIFKSLAKTPVLFADVRHYEEKDNFFDLCNSGEHATYFASKSFNPEENLKKVELYPEGFYFPAGGASVRHIAAPGHVTLARLTRKNGKYWMAILPAEFLDFGEKKNEEKAKATQIEWPHAFARLEVSADEFLSTYDSNHTHGVYGDWIDELVDFCKIAGIEYKVYKK